LDLPNKREILIIFKHLIIIDSDSLIEYDLKEMKKHNQDILQLLKKELRSKKTDYWSAKHTNYGDEVEIDKDELKALLKKETQVFSVIVYEKFDVKDVRRYNNKDLFKVTTETINSPLDRFVNKFIYDNDRNHEISNKIKKEVKKVFNKSQGDDDFYKKFDLLFAKKIKSLKKELYSEVFQEYLMYHLDRYAKKVYKKLDRIFNSDSEDFEIQSKKIVDDYLKKHKAIKDKIHKEITSKTKEARYHRYYSKQLPKSLADHMSSHVWSQLFLKKTTSGTLEVASGSSVGSGTRENHGFFGHLFATVQNSGKNVPTFVISFNNCFKMKLYYSPILLLHGHDLTGNYRISDEKSSAILKNITKVYSPDFY
jgi:hypothetical protein